MPTLKLLRWDGSCNNGKWAELFIGRTGISLFRDRFTPPLPAEQCRRIVDIRRCVGAGRGPIQVVLFRRWGFTVEAWRYSSAALEQLAEESGW